MRRAQPPPPLRVRGVIENQEGQAIAVRSRDGRELTISLAANVTINGVAARRLDDIKEGDVVGIVAVDGVDGKLHALEVLILPECGARQQ